MVESVAEREEVEEELMGLDPVRVEAILDAVERKRHGPADRPDGTAARGRHRRPSGTDQLVGTSRPAGAVVGRDRRRDPVRNRRFDPRGGDRFAAARGSDRGCAGTRHRRCGRHPGRPGAAAAGHDPERAGGCRPRRGRGGDGLSGILRRAPDAARGRGCARALDRGRGHRLSCAAPTICPISSITSSSSIPG